MAIDKAFFEKHDVDLTEEDAVKVVVKAAKKLLKDCDSEDKYPIAKAKFLEIVQDFVAATS